MSIKLKKKKSRRKNTFWLKAAIKWKNVSNNRSSDIYQLGIFWVIPPSSWLEVLSTKLLKHSGLNLFFYEILGSKTAFTVIFCGLISSIYYSLVFMKRPGQAFYLTILVLVGLFYKTCSVFECICLFKLSSRIPFYAFNLNFWSLCVSDIVDDDGVVDVELFRCSSSYYKYLYFCELSNCDCLYAICVWTNIQKC